MVQAAFVDDRAGGNRRSGFGNCIAGKIIYFTEHPVVYAYLNKHYPRYAITCVYLHGFSTNITQSMLILYSNSVSTTSLLSDELWRTVVNQATDKIKSTISTHGTSVARLATNPWIVDHITTNFEDLSPPLTPPPANTADTQYWVMKEFLEAFEPVVADALGAAVPDEFMCITRFNLSTRVTDAAMSNVTMFGAYRNRTTEKLSVRWMDYKNGNAIMNADVIKSAQGESASYKENMIWASRPIDVELLPCSGRLLEITNEKDGPAYRILTFEFEFLFTIVVSTLLMITRRLQTLETGTISCYQSFWSKTGAGPENQPDGACRFSMKTEFGFTRPMDAIEGNVSKALMLFDSNLNIISGSVQNFKFPIRNSLALIVANRTQESVFLSLGSPSAIPSTSPILYDHTFGTVNLVYGAVAFNVTRSDKWIMCSVTFREEIYGRIEEGNRKVLIIVAVVAVGVFLASGLGMWGLAVRPLNRLAIAMDRLTVFDFATLENGDLLNVQSLIREIYVIQKTFSMMVKAFAGGIRSNRALQKQTQSPGTSLNSSSKTGNEKPLASSVTEPMPIPNTSGTALLSGPPQ
ncbi:hypothetical protein HK102_000505 [Quaeritorhiza haematococci]|nr:hypothetical protein HK102_000505 [Quaeritorhiza haematococci]